MKTYLLLLSFVLAMLSCSKKDHSPTGGSTDPNDQPVGASANDIMASTKYTSLRVEIQYMTGYQPDAAALTHLQNLLSTIVHKPGGITMVTTEIPASANTTLSLTDISQLEANNRTSFTDGSQLAIYVLYTNGSYTDPNVLGIAYKNTSIVMFGKKINDNSGGIGQASRTKLVATVVEHEMGHLMGLVETGSHQVTPHQDAAHGKHCNNSNCLMYYQAETTDITGFLITGNIPSFDANCTADLRANGAQ